MTNRYTSPTTDLAAFLLCNLSTETLNAHLDDLVELYYETMASVLDHLAAADGLWSREAYTLAQFKSDLAASWEYGFLLACWLVPMILSDDEDIPNFDELQESETVMEEFFEGHEEKMSRGCNETVKERFTGILEFGVRVGVI